MLIEQYDMIYEAKRNIYEAEGIADQVQVNLNE